MALTIVRRALSQRFPLGMDDVREFLRQELIPMARELREAFNQFASGPYDYGTVMSGTGAPVAAPSAARAIYIDLAGGALTTLYVWNGVAWEAK
jgi:hypothetical protein